MINTIRQEIIAYIDGNGLITPRQAVEGSRIGSDNGPMYTAEYYVILQKLGLLTPQDIARFHALISSCISSNGMLNRVPVGQDDGQEQADDYYAVLNACYHLGITDIPRRLLGATFNYLGFLNNVEPGTKTLDSFLIRQVSLLAAMVSASYPHLYKPGHILARMVFFPAFVWAAITIAISGFKTPTGDTDSRRLSWHLLQVTNKVSLLCNLASLLWYHRLYNDYGPEGMKNVAYIYYEPHGVHPFSQYWKD